jgi:hypothetical protein
MTTTSPRRNGPAPPAVDPGRWIGEQLPNDTLAYCHHTPDRPLAAYLAPPDDPGSPARRVRTGAVAGLVLLHVPLASALAASDAGLVRTVLIDGSLITGA